MYSPQHQQRQLQDGNHSDHSSSLTVLSSFSNHSQTSTSLTSPTQPSSQFPWGAKRNSVNGSIHSLGQITEISEPPSQGLCPPSPSTRYSASFTGHQTVMYSSPNFEHYNNSGRPASYHGAVHQAGRTPAATTAVTQQGPVHASTRDDATTGDYDYEDDPSPSSAPAPEDVRRGPSVRSRASEIEGTDSQSLTSHENRRGRPQHLSLPSTTTTSERPRSTSPRLRLPPSPVKTIFDHPPIPQAPSTTHQPRQPRALPLPPSASPIPSRGRSPLGFHSTTAAADSPDGSPSLKRGSGSARRMIAAWENGCNTHDLADGLPIPSAQPNGGSGHLSPPSDDMTEPIAASPSMPWPPPSSSRYPAGGISLPKPLEGQSTHSAEPSLSASTWSSHSDSLKRKSRDLSPAFNSPGNKNESPRSPFKRSPFKGIANRVKGFRKTKDKVEVSESPASSRTFRRLDDDSDWFVQPTPISAVPTGMFSDRSVTEEGVHDVVMDVDVPQATYSSPIIYLAPASGHPEPWLTSWATLSDDMFKITAAPVQPKSDAPVSRIQMGLAIPYSHIPKPPVSAVPLLQLPTSGCVDIRALSRDDVRTRRIPPAPDGVGTEVLEILLRDGSLRHIGVQGPTGTQSWTRAMGDAIEAAKRANVACGATPTSAPPSARSRLNPILLPQGSHDPPVQKIGDRWIKSGDFVGESASVLDSPTPEVPSGNGSGFGPRFPSLDQIDHPPVPPPAAARTLAVNNVPQQKTAMDLGAVTSKPVCTLPLNIQKHSAPVSPDVTAAPPVPLKKPINSLVEERRKAWTTEEGNVPSAPPRVAPSTRPLPAVAAHVPAKAAPALSRRVPVPKLPEPLQTDEPPQTPARATTRELPRTEPQGLRESLVAIFNEQNKPKYPASEEARRQQRSYAFQARIRAWQAHPADGSPSNPLSRNSSTKHEVDTQLSFDLSDLNPSRSASQRNNKTALDANALGSASDEATPTVTPAPTGVNGLGINAVGTNRTLPNLPPATRKAPSQTIELPNKLEMLQVPCVPVESPRAEMPKPSRLLAERAATPAAPSEPSSSTSQDMPRPSRLLADRSSITRSPASRISTMKDSNLQSPSLKPRGPATSLPKVSSAPRTPAKEPVAVPKHPPASLDPAPSTPQMSFRSVGDVLEPTSPAPASVSATDMRSPTPRLQSRVLAAASVFEPTIAKRTMEAHNAAMSPSISPSKRRTPLPVFDVVDSDSAQIGATSALAAGSNVQSPLNAAPSMVFPKTPSTPPPSTASNRFSTPTRAALNPAKFEVTTPKATASSNPYGAVRAALRPTPTGKSDLSDRPLSRMQPELTRPMGLFVVNKTPSDVTVSRLADNPPRGLETPKASDKAPVLGSALSLDGSNALQNAAASPSKASRVLSEVSMNQANSELVTQSVFTNKDLNGPQSRYLAALSDTPLAPSSSRPSTQNGAWFRDQASCGEAENDWATPEAVMIKLNEHSRDHHVLHAAIHEVSNDITNVNVGISTLTSMAMEQGRPKPINPQLAERLDTLSSRMEEMNETVLAIPPTLPPEELAGRLDIIGAEVQGIQAAVQESTTFLAQLVRVKMAVGEEEGERDGDEKEEELPAMLADDENVPPAPSLGELNVKLDALAKLMQEVIARQSDLAAWTAGMGAGAGGTLPAVIEMKNEATEDSSRDIPGAATEATPRQLPNVTELRNVPASQNVEEGTPTAATAVTPAQVQELLNIGKSLTEARASQIKESAAINDHLLNLDVWLRDHTLNSANVSEKLNDLVGSDPADEQAPKGLIADLKTMVAEQSQKVDTMVVNQGDRLDQLLQLMMDDRGRHEEQQQKIMELQEGAMELKEVVGMLSNYVEHELTEDIKGERIRFLEGMQAATSMNMQNHVNDFKKALSLEVNRSIKELGLMREQKKALEQQIADLFAFKAKHGNEGPPSPISDIQPLHPSPSPRPPAAMLWAPRPPPPSISLPLGPPRPPNLTLMHPQPRALPRPPE